MKHWNNLDFLRFALAFVVVIFHAVGMWAPQHIFFGSTAVPGFLAISGYVVLQSREDSRSLGHFWWKRFLRIYPLLIPVVVGAWFIAKPPVEQYVGHFLSAGIYGPINAADPTWTICIEETCYAVLCILWWMGAYRAKWPIAALFMASLSLPYVLWKEPLIVRSMLLPQAFLMGNLVWVYRDQFRDALKVIAVPVFGFTLLSVARPQWFGLGGNQLQLMVPFACISFGLFAPPIFAGWKKRFGDLSFGTYMLHFPILTLLGGAGLELGPRVATLCALTLVGAWLSWRFVESKALSLKDFRWKASRPDSLGTPEPSPLSAGS